jgi:Zn-dependent peptidase ImmA (M78 family)/DNA-binding XRE family transcriptional regulator
MPERDGTIAINIRRAREALGLSQEAAATAAGLSRVAYRNLESGASSPRDRTLVALARALHVRPEDLLRPSPALPRARFRALKRLNDPSKQLLAAARQLEDYADLEELLGERVGFRLAGIARQLSGPTRPIDAAQRARESLGLRGTEVIRDVTGLLEDRAGVKVLCNAVQTDAYFGHSVGDEDGGPAVIVNTWDRIPVERWIFTVAHELGHLLLHEREYDGPESSTEMDRSEQEANLFAGQFLMPDEAFRREWADAAGLGFYEQVLKVKRIFRVSYKTVLYRAQEDFGLQGAWGRFQAEHRRRTSRTLTKSEEPRALQREAFGWGNPEPSSAREPDRLLSADFEPDRRSRLVRQAVEAERISLGRAAEILDRSLAEMKALQASWA